MNRLQRYLFRNLLIATLYSTAGLTLTIWLSQSLRLIEIVVSAGAPMGMFLWLLLLTVPTFLGVVLPLALVGAILFTYNKMTTDSELVVMRAAGVGPFSLSTPALVLAVAVMAIVLVLNVWITPAAHRELVRMEYAVRSDYSQLFLREGVFNEVGDRFSVFLRDRDSDGNLHKVLIHDGRQPDKPVTIMGDRALMQTGADGTRFVVYDGNRQELDRKTNRLSQLFFERYAVDLKAVAPQAADRWPDARERSTEDLMSGNVPAQDDRMRRGLIAELHHRFSSPLLALTFALVALSALLSGEFNRRGQSSRVTIAVLLVMGLQAGALGLTSLAGKATVFVPLMYAMPVVALLPALWVMSRGLSLRPGRRREEADAGASGNGASAGQAS
ncbi:predicted permease (plasmid) [Azospirillum sp. B510]|uniref:LPS export ABC transporter permease LptF n=1 Tax=Azospirillum sp. (strain B510) TaxID=137722 RepID=UPI0001C4CAE1|nr:LPS export ABC transporter permease LptF [Azospirillum sp. B510]BAI75821.1 predicted permease [Azospirillum sp. B510]